MRARSRASVSAGAVVKGAPWAVYQLVGNGIEAGHRGFCGKMETDEPVGVVIDSSAPGLWGCASSRHTTDGLRPMQRAKRAWHKLAASPTAIASPRPITMTNILTSLREQPAPDHTCL